MCPSEGPQEQVLEELREEAAPRARGSWKGGCQRRPQRWMSREHLTLGNMVGDRQSRDRMKVEPSEGQRAEQSSGTLGTTLFRISGILSVAALVE